MEKQVTTDDNEPQWCDEQQIYIGGTVPENISPEELASLRDKGDGSLKIFGYGSLCWGGGTILSRDTVTRSVGKALGWKRCWCQRSADHRGTPSFVGIVCTLLSDEEIYDIMGSKKKHKTTDEKHPSMTEGLIYTVPSFLVEECLKELDIREQGGYARDIIDVIDNNSGEKVKALLYRGTPENPAFWLKPLIDLNFAAAIMSVAAGPSGKNAEYLYNLDDFLSSITKIDNCHVAGGGDTDTKTLASMCREFQQENSIFLLYGAGSNEHRQILLSSEKEEKHTILTEFVAALPKFDIILKPTGLYAGGGHSALLLQNGSLFLWGYNEFGQIGRSQKAEGHTINPLPNILVQKVALGHTHSLILEMNSGQLYAFGDDSRGQVSGCTKSTSGNKIFEPITPELLKNESFVDISAGLFHSAGINNHGELITWGYQKFGQCLKPLDKNSSIGKWKPEDGASLTRVACGRRNTYVVDEFNRVYTIGDNKYGQLGRSHTISDNDYGIPELVSGPLGEKNTRRSVTNISCGWSHCLVLTKEESNDDHNIGGVESSLYGCGRNNFGQLGLESKESSSERSTDKIIEFQKIKIETHGKTFSITDISCGSESSAILSNDGSIFTCGWNEHGNLSLGDTRDARSFTKITGSHISVCTVDQDANNELKQGTDRTLIACGGSHLLVIKSN